MKLEELFTPPDLIDLIESLDYIPQDLTWDNDEGTFTVNGNRFVVTIRPATSNEKQSYASFFNPVPAVGNLEFSAVLAGLNRTQDTTNNTKSGVFKVFGGVAYAAEQLIDKHQYKIVLCVAKRKASPTNFPSRVEAYRNIIPRIAKNIGWFSMELLSTNNETIFVMCHPSCKEGIQAVRTHLINYYGE